MSPFTSSSNWVCNWQWLIPNIPGGNILTDNVLNWQEKMLTHFKFQRQVWRRKRGNNHWATSIQKRSKSVVWRVTTVNFSISRISFILSVYSYGKTCIKRGNRLTRTTRSNISHFTLGWRLIAAISFLCLRCCLCLRYCNPQPAIDSSLCWALWTECHITIQFSGSYYIVQISQWKVGKLQIYCSLKEHFNLGWDFRAKFVGDVRMFVFNVQWSAALSFF